MTPSPSLCLQRVNRPEPQCDTSVYGSHIQEWAKGTQAVFLTPHLCQLLIFIPSVFLIEICKRYFAHIHYDIKSTKRSYQIHVTTQRF